MASAKHCTLMALALLSMFSIPAAAQTDVAQWLAAHNAARSTVGVAPLIWSTPAYQQALAYAQSQASHCIPLTHSGSNTFGENLAWRSASPYPPSEVVAAWVSENQYYDYTTNTCVAGKVCGHYTQVVWAESTGVGCASVACNDGGVFAICNYYPPGNYVGERPY